MPATVAGIVSVERGGGPGRELLVRDARSEAPYLCTLRLSSAVLGSMVGLLDSWVVSGRGRGEG